jgi:hypothetical protein
MEMWQTTLDGLKVKISTSIRVPKGSLWEEIEKALPLKKDYREIKIPKKRGGYRTIFIPSAELKKIQGKILRYLKKIETTRWGGILGLRGGSYVVHAKHHCNSRWLFQFDLKDAFPSVNIDKLKAILFQKIREEMFSQKETTKSARWVAETIIQLTTFDGKLPQGAPTSPFLFYIMLATEWEILWHTVFKELREHPHVKWVISCYVDGVVISTNKPIPPDSRERILKKVEEMGFKINEKKTRLLDCRHGTVMVCGLRVNGKGRVSLPKKKIRQWRGFINTVANEIENNPRMDDELRKKMKRIDGFVASLKPVYDEILPPQIAIPYKHYQQAIKFHSSMPT